MSMQPKEKMLNVEQVARMIGRKETTVRKLAREKLIPAGKFGKDWVFVEVDLIAYIRSQYPSNTDDDQLCSINAKTRPTGGSKSSTTDKQYSDLLGLQTKSRRSNITTN